MQAGAEVQAIREVEVRMGSSAVRISGATLSIKITALVIFVQITCVYIYIESIILLNQVAEWKKNSINCQNVYATLKITLKISACLHVTIIMDYYCIRLQL